MTFVLAGEIRMEGDQALAELREVKAAEEAVTGATTKMGGAARKAANDNRGLKKETKGAAGASKTLKDEALGAAGGVDALSEQERQAAADAKTFARAQNRAAGQTGNLIAQFNDVGVMMAAGQNPFQLAIQQGTQITQVIGPMGAAGAAKALGTAFLGMLSPINFITIGAIAAGAAMVNWLSSAGEEVLTLDEHLGTLNERLDAYRDASAAASVSTSDLREKFGSAADEARKELEALKTSERLKLEFEVEATLTTMIDESDLDFGGYRIDDRNVLATLFDATWFNGHRETRQMLDGLVDDYEVLAEAAEGSVSDQVKALDSLIASFEAAAKTSGSVTEAENTRLIEMRETLLKLREVQALGASEDGNINPADVTSANELLSTLEREVQLRDIIERYGDKSAQADNLRRVQAREDLQEKLAGLRIEQSLRDQLLAKWETANPRRSWYDEQVSAAKDYFQTVLHGLQTTGSAELKAIGLQNQRNTVAQAELAFGRDSLQAMSARHQLQQSELETEIATKGHSEQLAAAKREALNIAHELERVEIAGPINSAAGAAERLAERLGISLGLARKLAATGMGQREFSENTVSGFESNDPRAPKNTRPGVWTGGYSTTWSPTKLKKPKKKGGGAASALKREQQAIARLLADQRRQLAVLRETDPIQQELLRYREQMAKATDAERAELEKLIQTRLGEEQAFDRAKEGRDLFLSTSFDALEAMATQGARTADIWDQVRGALVRAALQATLLGEGPLAGIFGLGGKGGVLGVFASAIGLADGGPVWGMGGEREDKVPVFLSPNEHVVNARGARRYRPLLDAINAGADLPGLADGGSLIAPPATSGSGGSFAASPARVLLELMPSSLFKAEVREQSQEVTTSLIEDYDRNVAPLTARDALDDHRSIG